MADGEAEMASGWMIYFNKVLSDINQHHAKNMLLFLTKYSRRSWNPHEIKAKLNLDLEISDIHKKLEIMRKADLIYGNQDYKYRGQRDGTFYLVLQERVKNEMEHYSPEKHEGVDDRLRDLKQKNLSLQGKLSNSAGHVAELQFAFNISNREEFLPSVYFPDLQKEEKGEVFVLKKVHRRFYVQFPDGSKKEIDLKVDSNDDRTLLIEVKKQKRKMGIKEMKDFWEKIRMFKNHNPDRKVLSGFLALGGFTEESLEFCQDNKIGTATQLNYYQKEWSIPEK